MDTRYQDILLKPVESHFFADFSLNDDPILAVFFRESLLPHREFFSRRMISVWFGFLPSSLPLFIPF